MSLQLHRPDGKGGLEVRTSPDRDWRTALQSARWGKSLRRKRLPVLRNPEMDPTSNWMAVAFWVGLAVLTLALLVIGYGIGFWEFPAIPSAAPPEF
jgi:hypothetical protein